MENVQNLCGWVPNPEGSAELEGQVGSVGSSAGHLLSTPKKDAYLWLALLAVLPNWRRGAQGIGDCVSWGAELASTMLMALQHVKGVSRFVAEAATEPIYGGCRVEALGKRSGGWSDGAFGAAAAKWMRDWGVLLRVPYAQETGNQEHDLTRYDKERAKNWGNYGCGGQHDQGKLDAMAKLFPCQHVVACKSALEAAAAIANGYTVTIASMAGYGDMRRDSRGIVRRSGQWAHQMMLGGVRWVAGEPLFRCFQSWGAKSASGPDPGIESEAISGCSWWITAEDLEWICKSGDCWVIGDVHGLPPQSIDLIEPASRWAHAGVIPSSYTLAK